MENPDEFSDRVYKVRNGNENRVIKCLSENRHLFPNANIDMMLTDKKYFVDVIVFETPEDHILFKLKYGE